jgi:predicted ATPase
VGDALLVPGAITSSVGVGEQTGRPIRDTLLGELRLRTLHVLLDNCEHQVETCAALADDFFEPARACESSQLAASRCGFTANASGGCRHCQHQIRS